MRRGKRNEFVAHFSPFFRVWCCHVICVSTYRYATSSAAPSRTAICHAFSPSVRLIDSHHPAEFCGNIRPYQHHP
jgi:hypothetical protein